MRRDELFERLDPPPGGLAKLRARLDARRPARRAYLAVAFAALAVAVVVLLVGRPRAPDLLARAQGRANVEDVGLGLARAPARPVALVDGKATALAEVKTSDPHVVFVWVASTE